MDSVNAELTEKIINRECSISKKKRQRMVYTFSTVMPVLFVLLIGLVTSVSEHSRADSLFTEAYAASLASSGIGGYVMMAVIAFAFGSFVTICCVKYHQTHKKGRSNFAQKKDDGKEVEITEEGTENMTEGR